MSKYKHIFFDLDRTLWDFETNSFETLSELSIKYKFKDLGIDSIDSFITQYNPINNRMWDEYGKGIIDKKTLRYGRFSEALLKFNINDKQLAKQFADDYIASSPLKTSLFPHTKEVLEYLNQKYFLHIITNGFEEVQHTKLKKCKIDHYFNQIITSEQVGFNKPDIRIFHYSLSAANTTTEDSLMIGDNLQADIVGARNAGMNQVFFNNSGEVHDELITHEISSLKELLTIL